MSTMPEVKIMRGGAVGSRKKTITAMKFMARNQLRMSVQLLRRCVNTQISVADDERQVQAAVGPDEEGHERLDGADARLDPRLPEDAHGLLEVHEEDAVGHGHGLAALTSAREKS